MNERISILEEIQRGKFEASLITTFNAYLPFYEDVVLRKLTNQGVMHNVLLMDASQCAQSIAHHPPRLAGKRYTLLPISSAGAFHPKIILLVGKKHGLLLVGSHNLTLSGFGYNRELTNVIRAEDPEDNEAFNLIQSAWQQIQGWINTDKHPHHLVDMILKLKSFAPWLKKAKEQKAEEPRPFRLGTLPNKHCFNIAGLGFKPGRFAWIGAAYCQIV